MSRREDLKIENEESWCQRYIDSLSSIKHGEGSFAFPVLSSVYKSAFFPVAVLGTDISVAVLGLFSDVYGVHRTSVYARIAADAIVVEMRNSCR